MSLRARILLFVVAVNVVVTVLLATFFAVDLRDRDKALRVREQRVQEVTNRGLQLVFGMALEAVMEARGLVLEIEDSKKDDVAERLLHHPVRSIIDDGVIFKKYPDLLASGETMVTRPYMNLKGAKRRTASFREQEAQRRTVEAIEKQRLVVDGPWIAAPIYLKEFGASVSDNDTPWGGGYFRLSQVEQLEEWDPAFGSLLYWVMGLGTVLLVLLTWLLLERWVFKPLQALAQGADRVAESSYGQSVPGEDRKDEIGRLVSSFNSMMAEVAGSQRHLEDRVTEASKRAEESSRGLVIAQRLAATGTLASGIAHEINNPLGGMINAALRLAKEIKKPTPDREILTRYVDLLSNGLKRVQEIVGGVLRFSPRQKQPSLASVRDLVKRAVALAEHRAHRAEVAIDVMGGDATVLAVPGEIQQVVLNLLLNACDAMEGRPGRVEVGVEKKARTVEITVRDQGLGMTPEQREQAFDLFFTTKEVGQGTGLGLSVAHHIVNQHGGQIRLESSEGKGAVFTVSLPIAPEHVD